VNNKVRTSWKTQQASAGGRTLIEIGELQACLTLSGSSTKLSFVFLKWVEFIVDTQFSFTYRIVPRTAAISRRRQSIKPQVAVKSICDRPAADHDSWRRRR
jgi:hypothetical protein